MCVCLCACVRVRVCVCARALPSVLFLLITLQNGLIKRLTFEALGRLREELLCSPIVPVPRIWGLLNSPILFVLYPHLQVAFLYFCFLSFECVLCLRVECLFKTDSGYPKDTEVLEIWRTLGISYEQSLQANVGNQGDDKIGCSGGIGENLGKMLRARTKTKKKLLIFCDCPYRLWRAASGARRLQG